MMLGEEVEREGGGGERERESIFINYLPLVQSFCYHSQALGVEGGRLSP